MMDLESSSRTTKEVSLGSSETPFIQKMGTWTLHKTGGWSVEMGEMNVVPCTGWSGNGFA